MSLPRLAGITIDVADHPIATERLVRSLGLHALVLDAGVEVRLDSGAVVQLMQSATATRVGLRFAVRDLCAAATALDDYRTEWTVTAPNLLRIERGDLTVEVTEGESTSLVEVTVFVSDVAAAAEFWRTLDLETVDTAGADPADPDPAEPAVDVRIGDATVRLRAAGLDRVTAAANTLVRVDGPLGRCVGLDHAGWEYRRFGDILMTRTPDGCGVWVAPPRRATPA